jgi:hypothetical protein
MRLRLENRIQRRSAEDCRMMGCLFKSSGG